MFCVVQVSSEYLDDHVDWVIESEIESTDLESMSQCVLGWIEAHTGWFPRIFLALGKLAALSEHRALVTKDKGSGLRMIHFVMHNGQALM